MKKSMYKELAGFIGMLLAIGAVTVPLAQVPRTSAAAPEVPAESPISDDYAEAGLFDDTIVHTINVLIDKKDWRWMTTHATEEQYVTCDVEIDGERIENVGIRPKGNSSLSSISQQGSTHFSYKLEFDHYDPAVTYHGLDKLCLNNLGQDPSCMKDFMAYHLMNDAGVAAPLSSYAVMQVNGQDLELCLAVEAVEDSFCVRNYGEDGGQLYKPDSFSIDTLDTSALLDYHEGSSLWVNEQIMDGTYFADANAGDRADILGTMLGSVFTPEQTAVASLRYVGGHTDDYADLWDSAVFDPSKADKVRLVESVERLNGETDRQSVLDVDALLRYFAAHSFVNNYDGYTSLFVHNFYLHEQDGILSLVPWDYNLAFGSFTYEGAATSVLAGSGFDPIPETGAAMDVTASMINYPIDTPVYSVDMADRPLLDALLSDPATLARYHEIYSDLLERCFENGRYAALFDQTCALLRPYVQDGLTFYETAQFERGAETMGQYLGYRAESVRAQLDGTLPATLEGQREDPSGLIDPVGMDITALSDFASLMPLLDETLIPGVLRVFLQDRYEYTTKGAVAAIHGYLDHPLSLLGRIPALLEIGAIRAMVWEKAAPVVVIVVLMIVLLVLVRTHRRRELRRTANAVPGSVALDPFFA